MTTLADHEPERDIYETSVHPIVHLRGLVITAVGALMGVAWLWLVVEGQAGWAVVVLIMASVTVVIGSAILLRSHLRYSGIKVIVTNLGVVRRRKRLFRRKEETIVFDHTVVLDVDQKWPLGTWLNFGDVEIDVGHKVILWRDIANPRKFVQEIKSHRQHEHGQDHLVPC